MEATGYLPEDMTAATTTGELLHLDRTDVPGLGTIYYPTIRYTPYPGLDTRFVTFTVRPTTD